MEKQFHRKIRSQILQCFNNHIPGVENENWLHQNRGRPGPHGSGKLIQPSIYPLKNYKIKNTKKQIMKTALKNSRLFLLTLLFLLVAGKAWSQQPYPNSGDHTVCVGEVAPYGVINTPGSTYNWSVTPVAGGNGLLAPGNTNLTSVTWNTPGTARLQVIETDAQGCVGTPVQILVTITPNNTITLTSGVGSDAQTICFNSPIANITYATTGATGASFAGLPAGVTGNWNANIITVSGTPTVSGTFNYTVTLTGGCGTVASAGSVTVTAANTIILSSPAGTDAQTVCINTPIASITYATTGATGASFAGLPAGVTGSWNANIITVSGTPTVSGTFNYTVTLTGGCGTVASAGSVTVTAANTIILSSPAGTDNQSVCTNTAITDITYATTSATGANVTGLPAGVTGTFNANAVTISGSPTVTGTFNYTVTLTGGCGTVTATGTINVTVNNTIALTSTAGTDNQSVCVNSPITTITYSTTGAAGATFTGLPAGVTATWAGNVVTITGTPTATGTFNFTITLTGGCGTITATGTITVNALPVTSPIYHN